MVQLSIKRTSRPVAARMRIVQEVYVGRKGGPDDTWSYCFFVKLDASKLAWEGSAHSKEEAAVKAKSSLRCSNLKVLINARSGIDSVVVRFRLEWYVQGGGEITSDNDTLPLISRDWPILMAEMALVAYGPPNTEARFREIEAEGLRPPRRRR